MTSCISQIFPVGVAPLFSYSFSPILYPPFFLPPVGFSPFPTVLLLPGTVCVLWHTTCSWLGFWLISESLKTFPYFSKSHPPCLLTLREFLIFSGPTSAVTKFKHAYNFGTLSAGLNFIDAMTSQSSALNIGIGMQNSMWCRWPDSERLLLTDFWHLP